MHTYITVSNYQDVVYKPSAKRSRTLAACEGSGGRNEGYLLSRRVHKEPRAQRANVRRDEDGRLELLKDLESHL